MCDVTLQEYAEAALLTWSGKESGCLVVNRETGIGTGPSSFFVKSLCQTHWVGFFARSPEERDAWIDALRHSQLRSEDGKVQETSTGAATPETSMNTDGVTPAATSDTETAAPGTNNGIYKGITHVMEPNGSHDKTLLASVDAHAEVRRLRIIVEQQAESLATQAKELQLLHAEFAVERKYRNDVVESNLVLSEKRKEDAAMIEHLSQLLVAQRRQLHPEEKDSNHTVEEIRNVAKDVVAQAQQRGQVTMNTARTRVSSVGSRTPYSLAPPINLSSMRASLSSVMGEFPKQLSTSARTTPILSSVRPPMAPDLGPPLSSYLQASAREGRLCAGPRIGSWHRPRSVSPGGRFFHVDKAEYKPRKE